MNSQMENKTGVYDFIDMNDYYITRNLYGITYLKEEN